MAALVGDRCIPPNLQQWYLKICLLGAQQRSLVCVICRIQTVRYPHGTKIK